MKLDKLFEDAVSEKQSGKLEGFLASHKWVGIFFLLETNVEDIPINTKNIMYIITTGKGNPINILTTNNGYFCNQH